MSTINPNPVKHGSAVFTNQFKTWKCYFKTTKNNWWKGYGAAPSQPYGLSSQQQATSLPPPNGYGYQQQYQQSPAQFSAAFQQQQGAQYGSQPIYQTPDALQQTQSQTGFNPQQPVYANNFPGGFPGAPGQQGFPQQAY